MNMRFSVLGSGSRGNSVYIESGRTAILIDNGFSGKEIAARLKAIGKDTSDLDAIFVTHEHNDHIGGVGVLSRRCGLRVYANQGTFRGGEEKLGKLFKICESETGDTVELQDLEIKSFAISHDTSDPVGYVVGNGHTRLGYCTDTGKVTLLMRQRLQGCNGLILEFNHDLKMLAEGPYPLALQQRVRSSQGHLANSDAAAFLRELLHDGLEHVVLAHLSETNNLPDLAIREAKKVIAAENTSTMILARQDHPTGLLSLSELPISFSVP
jgi:phosphoribosyl 1,2-cyclic phosphodiesterase